jgi:hypothetical protein
MGDGVSAGDVIVGGGASESAICQFVVLRTGGSCVSMVESQARIAILNGKNLKSKPDRSSSA